MHSHQPDQLSGLGMGSRGRAEDEMTRGEEGKGPSGQDSAGSPTWTPTSLGSVGRRAEGAMVSRDLSLQGMKGSVLGWGRDVLEIDFWGVTWAW